MPWVRLFPGGVHPLTLPLLAVLAVTVLVNCGGDDATCSHTLTVCAGTCVDTRLDPAHCGACGAACETYESCHAGRCNRWKTIAAGAFQMGSPHGESCRGSDETQHQVTLTRTFEVQRTEVTQAQFAALMGYSPPKFSSCGSTCPMESVTWHEAAAYANALSAQKGKARCYACTGSGESVTCTEAPTYAGAKIYACPGYRLPTEAEWEFAYRAGTSTAFYNGGITSCFNKDPGADKIGWYWENSQASYAGDFSGRGTHPVGQKAPNAWGLYDMAGNVWEWCHDRYGSYPLSSVTDPVGTSGSKRTLRGGGWTSFPYDARAAYRHNAPPDFRFHSLGFRVVRSIP